jgi:hypothetical protein
LRSNVPARSRRRDECPRNAVTEKPRTSGTVRRRRADFNHRVWAYCDNDCAACEAANGCDRDTVSISAR